MPITKWKIEFPKVLQSLSTIKSKNKSRHPPTYLVETFALIRHSKIVFKKLFWLKLFILQNTLDALISS